MTDEWKKEFQEFADKGLWQGEDEYTKNFGIGTITDWFISKHKEDLQTLLSEIEGMKKDNLKATAWDYGYDTAINQIKSLIKQRME